MSDLRLRIGLVGAGRWGRTIAKVIGGMPALHLSAVASRNPETSSRLAADCVVVENWRELLEMPLDGLVVATPPQHHRDCVRAAMQCGLPVLVEKPLTLSLPEADELVALARAAGSIVMVDHTQLFAPGITALGARLSCLGPALGLRLRAGAWGPFRPDVPVVWDWGAHDVAIALHLLQATSAVVTGSDLRPASHSAEGRDGHAGSAHFALAVTGPRTMVSVPVTIEVSNVLRSKERSVEVTTARGSLTYREYPRRRLIEQPVGGGLIEHAVAGPGPLDLALLAFARTVRAGTGDLASLLLGREVVRILSEVEAVG